MRGEETVESEVVDDDEVIEAHEEIDEPYVKKERG